MDAALAWGLQGVELDLDASEELSKHYLIKKNTQNTLSLYTDDDLSIIVGNDLVGVHRLNDITVMGGASLSFGGDKVYSAQVEAFYSSHSNLFAHNQYEVQQISFRFSKSATESEMESLLAQARILHETLKGESCISLPIVNTQFYLP